MAKKVEMHILEIDGKLVPGRACCRCDVVKPMTDFHTTAGATAFMGRNSMCKECDNARNRTYRNENPTGQVKQRENYLLYNHNITPDEYIKMCIEQEGKCAICEEKPEKLHIDHCHKSEQIRGLLCHKCNTAIGLLQDDTKILERAITYLLRYQFEKK